MRITASILVFVGMLLIALGRHFIRRARRRRRHNPALSTWRARLAGWTLVSLGFLALLAGVCIW